MLLCAAVRTTLRYRIFGILRRLLILLLVVWTVVSLVTLLIELVPGEAAQPRRRPYRLTEHGTTVLREELDRLSRITAAAIGRLNGIPTI